MLLDGGHRTNMSSGVSELLEAAGYLRQMPYEQRVRQLRYVLVLLEPPVIHLYVDEICDYRKNR